VNPGSTTQPVPEKQPQRRTDPDSKGFFAVDTQADEVAPNSAHSLPGAPEIIVTATMRKSMSLCTAARGVPAIPDFP
jgi:hypothetical protein